MSGGAVRRPAWRRAFALAAASAAAWATAASAAAADPSPPSASDDANAAYFVIGVQPDQVQLRLEPVSIKDGQIVSQTFSLLGHYYGPPTDHFTMVKVPAGTDLALLEVRNQVFGNPHSHPCGKTFVLHAEAGKVVYVFSAFFIFDYRYGVWSVTPEFSTSLDKARAFLSAHYPQLADRLEQGQPQMVDLAPRMRDLTGCD